MEIWGPSFKVLCLDFRALQYNKKLSKAAAACQDMVHGLASVADYTLPSSVKNDEKIFV
jgi:hypothetical protein